MAQSFSQKFTRQIIAESLIVHNLYMSKYVQQKNMSLNKKLLNQI